MENIKKIMDPKVLTVLIAVSVLVGWQYSLFLAIAIYCLSDNENMKQLLTKTLIFSAGLLLFKYGWNVIESLINIVMGALADFVNYLYSLEVLTDYEVISNINNYFITPVNSIAELIGDIVSVLVIVAELTYAAGILTGSSKGFIFGMIDKTTTKITNKIMGNVNPAPTANPTPANNELPKTETNQNPPTNPPTA